MESRAECGLAMRAMPETLEEVQHFLDTWCFTISDDGYFYARPQPRNLTLADVRAFLKRLDLICGDGFPRLIAIDFSRRYFNHDDWNKCEALIREFALRIRATPVFEPRSADAAFVVLIRAVHSDTHGHRSITTHRQPVRIEQQVP